MNMRKEGQKAPSIRGGLYVCCQLADFCRKRRAIALCCHGVFVNLTISHGAAEGRSVFHPAMQQAAMETAAG